MVYTDEDTSQLKTDFDAPPAAVVGPELSNDIYTRLAQTPIGRKIFTALIGFLAVIVALPNLPSGPFTDGIDVLWSPVTDFGLRQSWHVFSPNPRAVTLNSKAVIEHDDGSIEIWQVPNFDATIGSYREYRWRKWEERIGTEAAEDHWEPTALWLAEQYQRDGDLPVRITLVERTRAHWPVAVPDPIDGEWAERAFYTWERDT